ncbi:MAG: hypothetical protein J6334_13265 [Kiritimatiellae bacterium]|nr:hypothetical protein [Kiritimatiellia bacterium]
MIGDCLKRKSVWMPLVFLALFALLMLYVFAPVLPLHIVTLSPDYPKFFLPAWRVIRGEQFLSGSDPWLPSALLDLLGHPLGRHSLFFVVTSCFAALGVRYYLKTQNLSPLAAWGGGLAFAFIGYSFTLFNAGHAGYFDLIASVLFTFGLMARCFQTGRFPYFLALGATLIWAEVHQPDIWLLFVLLLGAYAIWCSVKCYRAEGDCRFMRTVWPRFLLTLAVAALAGTLAIRNAFTQALAGRKEQLTTFSQGAPAAKPTPEEQRRQDEANWIFATNWSLPPEDIAEFFVPGIWGDASFQPPMPYWGRLGQPYPFQPGRAMPNYRQHTVYLGTVLLLMAFAGIAGWFGLRKNRVTPESGDGDAPPDFSDVPFWCVTALLCTLLALGRYTPLYRAVYALPYMHYMRCPVKFHHLTEFAVTALAGFGLEALVGQAWGRVRKQTLIAGAAGAVILVIGWVLSLSLAPVTVAHIKGLGLAQYAEPLARYTATNLGRTLLVSALALAILFALGRVRSRRGIALVGALLPLLGAVDLATVARRYVVPFDVSAHYARNGVVQAFLQRSGGQPARIANYATQGSPEQDWFGTSLLLHGFENMLPTADTPDRMALYQAMKDDPLAYWRLNGVRFVILPHKAVPAFTRLKSLQPFALFSLTGNGKVQMVQQPDEKSFACCELLAAPVLPALYAAWQGTVPATNQLAVLTGSARPAVPVSDAPAAPAASGPARAVRFDAVRGQVGVWKTAGVVENPNPAPALLVFSEKAGPDLRATVDGAPVPLYTADAQWAALLLPPGKHTVSIGKALHPFLPIFNTLVGILAAATLCVRRWRGMAAGDSRHQ